MRTDVLWSRIKAREVFVFGVERDGEDYTVEVSLHADNRFCCCFVDDRCDDVFVPYGGDTNSVTTPGQAAVRAVQLQYGEPEPESEDAADEKKGKGQSEPK